jgi:hypothetical protein
MSLLFYQIPPGSTNQDIPVNVYDNASTTGAKLAGLVYNSGGMTAGYKRQGAAGSAVTFSLVTKTRGTWASCGFVAISSSVMPGTYELGLPNAAIATGANWVQITMKGYSRMVPVDIFVDLNTHSANVTKLAGTVVAARAAGYFPADLRYVTSTALVTHTAGTVPADVRYLSSVALAAHASGQIPADLRDILGTAASPSSTAGILDVNVRNIANAVVNTNNAQLGTKVISYASGQDAGTLVLATPANKLYTDGSGYVQLHDVGGVQKNTALAKFEFLMVDTSGNAKTGLTITAQRSIDGGAFGSCANSATELANGIYYIDLAATDLNGTVITLRFSATGAADRFITIKTNA